MIQTNDVDDLVSRLGQRRESFGMVVEYLRRLGRRANVVETGCIRSVDDYGAGYSTMLWELLSREIDLRVVSIDITPANIEFAKHLCHAVRFIRGDSVFTLHMMQGQQIDVLYLDSFDLDQTDPHPAALHGLLELTAASRSLISGSLVMVDDNYDHGIGKGAYVDQFMELTGRRLLHDGLQKSVALVMGYLVHIRTMAGTWHPIWPEVLPLESARDLAQTVRRCQRRDGCQPLAFWIRPIYTGNHSGLLH